MVEQPKKEESHSNQEKKEDKQPNTVAALQPPSQDAKEPIKPDVAKPKEKKIILHADAYKTVILYATRYANASIPREQWKEIYGVLIGYVTDDAIIVEQAEPMTYGHDVDVELDAEHYAFIAEINDTLFDKGEGKFLVGWFHSHPGLTLFYSFIDIKNQIGFQGPNNDSFGLVFDHTYLLDQKTHPNHPGFEIYRLNDPTLTMDDPNFDNNYHKVDYEIVGLNEFFFANVLTELSAYAAAGGVLQKAYREDYLTEKKGAPDKKTQAEIIKNRRELIANSMNIVEGIKEEEGSGEAEDKEDGQKISAEEKERDIASLQQNQGKISENKWVSVDKSKIPQVKKIQIGTQNQQEMKSLTQIPIAESVKTQVLYENQDQLKQAEKFIFEGKTAFLINDSFSAVENYNSAISILESLGTQYEAKILDTLADIAEACLKSNHDNLALEFADKLKIRAEQTGDFFQMGNGDYYKAVILLKKGNTQEGLDTLKNAAVLYENSGDYAGVGKINHEIGDFYLKSQEWSSAALFYVEAITNYEKGIIKFHPKRRSEWALPIKLTKTCEVLKSQIKRLLDSNITDPAIKTKIINDLKKL